MSQEPKKRHARARQGKRRASIKHTFTKLTKCTNCSADIHFHTVCPECGYYKGVKVLQIKAAKSA